VHKGKDTPVPFENEGVTGIEKNQESILFNNAVSLTRDNRIDEAKLAYRKVLRINPGHIKALNDLGVLLLHEGEYELASSYFQKAVRLDPENVDPYYNLACLYALSGNKEKGMVHLVKAADLDSRVKEWARKDNDLASLKDLPEFNEIIE
jgi:Flp pilus assembly protein TadD